MALTANRTIVRVRRSATGTDRYGDPVDATETRTAMDNWAVAPRTSSDVADRGRAGVIVGLTLFAPADADLQPTDLVEVDGERYEIEGEPGQWKSPLTGWDAGLEVALRKATG